MSLHKVVGLLAWLLTGLCALEQGLLALGYNVLSSLTPEHIRIVHLVFGGAGVISLLMLLGMLAGHSGCGKCGTSGCTC